MTHNGNKPWSLPVIEDSPAFSDEGRGAAEIVNHCDGHDPDPAPAYGEILGKLHDLATFNPRAPALLLLKLYGPHLSHRELAARLGISKSMVGKLLRRVAAVDTSLEQILAGHGWKSSRGQRARWSISQSL